MKILSALILFLFLAPNLSAKTLNFNKSRTIEIVGEVDAGVLNKANQMLALASVSKAPIDVLISSPGGVISYGLYFIDAIKTVQANGVKVRCFVPQLAASMAYTIFTQCSERYALPYARLLFHAPRIGGEFLLTPQTAVQLAKGLLAIENKLLVLVIPVMGVTQDVGFDWFRDSYLDERMFLAGELLKESPKQWFTIVDNVEGCTNMLSDPWAHGTSNVQKSEFIYVYEQ